MKKYLIIFLFFVSLLNSCIKNDIPYPIVHGDITAFEVAGQKGESVIDSKYRTVSIEVEDTVILSNVRLLRMEVSNNAKVSPELSSHIDLSKDFQYTLTTYQDYVWTIKATQKVERYIKVENQVGETLFDIDSKTALIKVSNAQSLKNIVIKEIKLGPINSVISPDPSTVHDFTRVVSFSVLYNGKIELWKVQIVQTTPSLETNHADAWAKHATIYGTYVASMGSPTFLYKKATDSEWVEVPFSKITIDGSSFSTSLSPLTPGVEYNYKATAGGNSGEVKSFTTELDAQLPNMSFDDWFKSGKNWFPDKDLSSSNYIWDSGNIGANTLTETNPTSPEETVVAVSGSGKKAAKLTSASVLGILAGGNVYSGFFVERSGTNAKISFGRPYTSRPKYLKGHYSYIPQLINKTKEPYTSLAGQSDICRIFVMLTDWETPYIVDTSKKNFIDPNTDSGVIAYGELVNDKDTKGYKEFSIELVYRDSRKPKHCVVVATASKYADYFTGGEGSTLYIDEFEFVFD